MIEEKVFNKLKILEKLLKTEINTCLYTMKNVQAAEKKGENFVIKHSKSNLHNTDYLINPTYHKTIYQPFIMPESYGENK